MSNFMRRLTVGPLWPTWLALAAIALVPAGCSNQPAVPTDGARSGAAPAAFGAQVAAEGDWPRWRGPAGDGVSREKDWHAHWPASGPPKLWSAEIGTGFSSFSVAGGRLYTMGHVDDHDVVWCLDALTGKLQWRHQYPAQLVANLHEGGPACTPTCDAGRVYTISKDGKLWSLDAVTGQPHWNVECQPLLGVEMPQWGFSCSPLIDNELLIVDAGRTVAFDKLTGKIVWQTEKFRPGYGSPVIFDTAGRHLVAVLNNDCLLVLQASDGQIVDRFAWETSYATSATTPILSGNQIFLSAGYDHGCTLLELVDGRLGVVYENKHMRNHMNNSVLWQGYLYGFDGNSHARRQVTFTCMEWKSGEVKWKERGLGCGSCLVADGKLIALGDEGELVIAPATPRGFEPISRAQVIEGRCWTVPVLSHGRIYCRNADGHLVCLDVR